MDAPFPIVAPLIESGIDERAQSPSQESTTDNVLTRPGKRKLSSSTTSESPAPPPISQEPAAAAVAPPAEGTGPEPSLLVAPLPTFAPPPVTLPELDGFQFFATRSHPFNKHGFRYTPCGPSRDSPLPVPPQRTIESEPCQVRWSWEDRSAFTYLTQDATTVTTDKGWRGVRSNIGLREGCWYWEIEVERGGGQGGREHGGRDGQGSWVRVGVGRRESPLNAPVGVDGYSYGIRDKTGDSIHLSRPTRYAKPFGTNSTIGVYLSLPAREPVPTAASVRDPRRIQRKRVPIRYKGQLYFEQLEYPSTKEMDELTVDPVLKAKQEKEAELKLKEAKKKQIAQPGKKVIPLEQNTGPTLRPVPTLRGSKLAFSIDGEYQGTAFEDLYDFLPLMKPPGSAHSRKDKSNRLVTENHHDDGATGYYPFVSVFGGGTVTINPGPEFKHAPTREHLDQFRARVESEDGGTGWRPLCDRYREFYEEQARLDDLDELDQIETLQKARDREQLRIQRQIDRAEKANLNGNGTHDGPATKKAKPTTATGFHDVLHHQVIGTVQGQEESPGNSPAPFAVPSTLLGPEAVKFEDTL
ncbi:Bre2p [Sporobolomyces koalae]|uniref:Bre2p n=1 Tax=Sporobolomyces koalae TaxID=500713 RepID=UPI00317A277F